jgi:transposase
MNRFYLYINRGKDLTIKNCEKITVPEKDVIKVDRFFASSKTCKCGTKNDDLKLSDREWTCKSCGAVNQRDLLAAQNILNEGRRSSCDLTDAEAEGTKPLKRLESEMSSFDIEI